MRRSAAAADEQSRQDVIRRCRDLRTERMEELKMGVVSGHDADDDGDSLDDEGTQRRTVVGVCCILDKDRFERMLLRHFDVLVSILMKLAQLRELGFSPFRLRR